MTQPNSEQTILQDWNAEDYGDKLRFITDMGLPLIEILKPQPGERILDLGCGDGPLMKLLEQAGAVVVGIDASEDMIDVAKADGLDALVMDAHHLPYKEEFDAVLSNAALHWMPRPDLVSEGVYRALKPGGRYVAEFGGYENVRNERFALNQTRRDWGLGEEEINPWYFPSAETHQACLEQSGFIVHDIEVYDRPTPMNDRMVIWLENFGKAFVADVPESDQRRFFEDAETALAPLGQNEDGSWTIDYVRCRFSASKPL